VKLSRVFPCLACVSWLAAPALPQAGTPIIVSIPGSTRTDITAINASGTMAGVYQTADAIYGFTATKPDLSDYVTIDIGAPGGLTLISGIGPEGTLVGSYCDGEDCSPGGPVVGLRAFLRRKSGAVSVWEYPAPGASFTRFLGINARGQIVGMYVNQDSVPCGFLLNKFGSDPIPIQYLHPEFPQPEFLTVPNGINSQGIVVGEIRRRTDPTTSWGFVWDGVMFTLFARPDGSGGSYGTMASSINDRGDIVGAYWLPDPWRLVGFHLRSGLYRDVAVEAKSVRLNDINNAGTIVGICYDDLLPVKIEGLIVPK